MPRSSMVDLKPSHRPIISYRPIRPSDLDILEQIHGDVFPIRYESEFFQNVVNGRDIVSWGAVDRNRPNGQNDEIIGFVTARLVLASESEIGDILQCDSSRSGQTLVYILTLGVVETYRTLGIASTLIREVLKYASSIPTCRAVYLHVISYNNPAIHFYKKMLFKCVRRLHDFYFINGHHYDSYLFVYYVNGGRSPCSPFKWQGRWCSVWLHLGFLPDINPQNVEKDAIELAAIVVTCMRNGFKAMAARLWKHDDKSPKWSKCKESWGLIRTTQTKRVLAPEGSGCECV